jgi:hypothetical protein
MRIATWADGWWTWQYITITAVLYATDHWQTRSNFRVICWRWTNVAPEYEKIQVQLLSTYVQYKLVYNKIVKGNRAGRIFIVICETNPSRRSEKVWARNSTNLTSMTLSTVLCLASSIKEFSDVRPMNMNISYWKFNLSLHHFLKTMWSWHWTSNCAWPTAHITSGSH